MNAYFAVNRPCSVVAPIFLGEDEEEGTQAELHLFAVGTSQLRDNALVVVEFDEERTAVRERSQLSVQGEVTALAFNAGRRGLACMATRLVAPDGNHEHSVDIIDVDLASAPGEGGEAPGDAVQSQCALPGHTSAVSAVLWDPAAEDKGANCGLITVEEAAIRHWRLSEGATKQEAVGVMEAPAGKRIQAAEWDPLHPTEVAAGVGPDIHIWDTRTYKPTRAIDAAHDGADVCAISYNPIRPWYLTTAGEDGSIRFWDARKGARSIASPSGGGGTAARRGEPLLQAGSHSHWASHVAFNPSHDQLVASAGSDGAVAIWRASSVSSAPLMELVEEEEEEQGAAAGAAGGRRERMLRDAAIGRYSDQQDAVASLAWSATNPWVLVSLDYSGRLSFVKVPESEKWAILL